MFALTTGLIDMFPGPTIEARSGDTLLITVTNAVEEESIALHWHGIHVTSMCLIPVIDGNPLIIEPRQLTPCQIPWMAPRVFHNAPLRLVRNSSIMSLSQPTRAVPFGTMPIRASCVETVSTADWSFMPLLPRLP